MEETAKTSVFVGNTISNSVFTPQDRRDNPCDVILVVGDGNRMKAHRAVLVEASPFFEKLLSTDMKEAREGVIHLNMLTESVLADILEFMYTGTVQITNEERALFLIEMADYLILPNLKSLAERVAIEKLHCSNCLSIYHFADAFDCKELFCGTRKFIMNNFKKILRTTDEFLNNISHEELEIWISSDDINVNAEEDVFEFILTWINQNKFERSKYFEEFFRHVRLTFVSKDYIQSKIMTSKLVHRNKDCTKLVNTSMKSSGKTNRQFTPRAEKPRESLQTPVMLFFERKGEQNNLCYFPREDTWCSSPSVIPRLKYRAFSSQDKLYLTGQKFVGGDFNLLCYDSFSNRLRSLSTLCTSLSLSKGVDPVCHIFVRGENEIFALIGQRRGPTQERHLSCITRYNPEASSWEDVSTFDWDSRTGVCIVNKDNFIYFVGGRIGYCCKLSCLRETHRYDLSANKWERVADMKEERCEALGAVAHGKLFVAGGTGKLCQDSGTPEISAHLKGCEFYNESTDEWHITACLTIPHISESYLRVAGLLCVDATLYAVCEYSEKCSLTKNQFVLRNGAYYTGSTSVIIVCYDPENDKWTKKTELPDRYTLSVDQVCSINVFNRSKFIKAVSSATGNNIPAEREVLHQMRGKQNCLIM